MVKLPTLSLPGTVALQSIESLIPRGLSLNMKWQGGKEIHGIIMSFVECGKYWMPER